MRIRLLGVGVTAALAGCSLLTSLDGLHEPTDAAADGAAPDSSPEAGVVFVQQTALTTASPGQIALPTALGSGTTVVVGVAFPVAFGSLQVTDTLSRSYVLVGSQDGVGKLAAYRIVVLAAIDGPGGLDTLTLTTTSTTMPDGGAGDLEAYVLEYRGITALDSSLTAAGIIDAAADAWVPWDAGALTTVRASELLFAFAYSAGRAKLDPSFVPRSAFNLNQVADEVTGAPGAYPVTGTANSSWVTIAAGFIGP